MAVKGQGYFQITLPDGDTGYTRAGFVPAQRRRDRGDLGRLHRPARHHRSRRRGRYHDQASGEVQVKLDGQIQPQTVGQIQLATFPNDAGLEAHRQQPAAGDRRLRRAGHRQPPAPGYGRLVQGALETRNVNIVAEITNLITAQRAYEMNSKVISTTDQMMTTTSQLR